MVNAPARNPQSDPAADCRSDQFEEPAIRAWLGWQRFLTSLDRRLDVPLREAGLTRNQLTVLYVLSHEEGLTQQELAERLGLTKASMSQMLTRLESAGLIERVPEARAYSLLLTAQSRDLLAQVLPAHYSLILQYFSVLNPLEQLHLATLTDKLERFMDDEVEPCQSIAVGQGAALPRP